MLAELDTFLGNPGLRDSLEEGLETTEPADICRGLLPDYNNNLDFGVLLTLSMTI